MAGGKFVFGPPILKLGFASPNLQTIAHFALIKWPFFDV